MSFDHLGLPEALLFAVERAGYKEATPIQQQAIPAVREGKDLLAAAQTGTGKTAAFALPILERIAEQPPVGANHVRALVLTPTRELATQVAETINALGGNLGDGRKVRCCPIFGGVRPGPQIDKMNRGVDVMVACPGRLLDHARNGIIEFSDVEILVLDEADRMLDMGFIHDIKRLLKMLPRQRQNLLFSATFSPDIRKLANRLLDDPETIDVTPKNQAAVTVEHSHYKLEKAHKSPMLAHLIFEEEWSQVLVFTRTKHGANKLTQQLQRQGIEAAAIHGNKSQAARQRALEAFKAMQIQVLVATDIAARGIDIAQLPVVINYDLPNVPEDYVHRIGRTGRAGMSGIAISLVGPDDRSYLKAIERILRQPIKQESADGIELPQLAAQPKQDSPKNSNNRNQASRRRRPNQRSRGSNRSTGAKESGNSSNEKPNAQKDNNKKPRNGGNKPNKPGQNKPRNSRHRRPKKPRPTS